MRRPLPAWRAIVCELAWRPLVDRSAVEGLQPPSFASAALSRRCLPHHSCTTAARTIVGSWNAVIRILPANRSRALFENRCPSRKRPWQTHERPEIIKHAHTHTHTHTHTHMQMQMNKPVLSVGQFVRCAIKSVEPLVASRPTHPARPAIRQEAPWAQSFVPWILARWLLRCERRPKRLPHMSQPKGLRLRCTWSTCARRSDAAANLAGQLLQW